MKDSMTGFREKLLTDDQTGVTNLQYIGTTTTYILGTVVDPKIYKTYIENLCHLLV